MYVPTTSILATAISTEEKACTAWGNSNPECCLTAVDPIHSTSACVCTTLGGPLVKITFEKPEFAFTGIRIHSSTSTSTALTVNTVCICITPIKNWRAHSRHTQSTCSYRKLLTYLGKQWNCRLLPLLSIYIWGPFNHVVTMSNHTFEGLLPQIFSRWAWR